MHVTSILHVSGTSTSPAWQPKDVASSLFRGATEQKTAKITPFTLAVKVHGQSINIWTLTKLVVFFCFFFKAVYHSILKLNLNNERDLKWHAFRFYLGVFVYRTVV